MESSLIQGKTVQEQGITANARTLKNPCVGCLVPCCSHMSVASKKNKHLKPSGFFVWDPIFVVVRPAQRRRQPHSNLGAGDVFEGHLIGKIGSWATTQVPPRPARGGRSGRRPARGANQNTSFFTVFQFWFGQFLGQKHIQKNYHILGQKTKNHPVSIFQTVRFFENLLSKKRPKSSSESGVRLAAILSNLGHLEWQRASCWHSTHFLGMSMGYSKNECFSFMIDNRFFFFYSFISFKFTTHFTVFLWLQHFGSSFKF